MLTRQGSARTVSGRHPSHARPRMKDRWRVELDGVGRAMRSGQRLGQIHHREVIVLGPAGPPRGLSPIKRP
jgi:hypothetical protein